MTMHPKFTLDAEWIRSTASEGYGECVEVAFVTVVSLRDSKDPDGPSLFFSGSEWEAFLAGVRSGEFSL
ncbi:DUF397 domain-containing protein [Actinomadura scrupuli]|uniref:DUF397 domain-containing protein n=1 Tax=Actinomadura scrupuli TaxID=559629 RepID=UPI003D99FE47